MQKDAGSHALTSMSWQIKHIVGHWSSRRKWTFYLKLKWFFFPHVIVEWCCATPKAQGCKPRNTASFFYYMGQKWWFFLLIFKEHQHICLLCFWKTSLQVFLNHSKAMRNSWGIWGVQPGEKDTQKGLITLYNSLKEGCGEVRVSLFSHIKSSCAREVYAAH